MCCSKKYLVPLHRKLPGKINRLQQCLWLGQIYLISAFGVNSKVYSSGRCSELDVSMREDSRLMSWSFVTELSCRLVSHTLCCHPKLWIWFPSRKKLVFAFPIHLCCRNTALYVSCLFISPSPCVVSPPNLLSLSVTKEKNERKKAHLLLRGLRPGEPAKRRGRCL